MSFCEITSAPLFHINILAVNLLYQVWQIEFQYRHRPLTHSWPLYVMYTRLSKRSFEIHGTELLKAYWQKSLASFILESVRFRMNFLKFLFILNCTVMPIRYVTFLSLLPILSLCNTSIIPESSGMEMNFYTNNITIRLITVCIFYLYF